MEALPLSRVRFFCPPENRRKSGGCPLRCPGNVPSMSRQCPVNVPSMSRQCPGNFRSVARQRPGNYPVAIRSIPTPLARVVMPAAERQRQPSCRHAPASPQGKVGLPVASSAPSRVRDELLFNFECPAREPCRPSSPAEQITTADADEIGSLSLKGKRHERAQVMTCSAGVARVAPSRPAPV